MRFKLARLHVVVICATIAATALPGCQRTLIFGERTGYNLNIRVGEDPKTPIQVNAGLRRVVGAFVPPAKTAGDGEEEVSDEQEGMPVGEAVSLFSGFRLHDYRDVAGPLNGTLVIKSQFASGEAAKELASEPKAVETIITVDNFVLTRSELLLQEARQERKERMLDQIEQLTDAAAISLAKNPPVNNPNIEPPVHARYPNIMDNISGNDARAATKMRVSMSGEIEAELDAWEAAIAAVQ